MYLLVRGDAYITAMNYESLFVQQIQKSLAKISLQLFCKSFAMLKGTLYQFVSINRAYIKLVALT